MQEILKSMQEDMFPKVLMHTWHFYMFKNILKNLGLDALQVSPACKYYSLANTLPEHPLDIKIFANESDYLVSHQPRLWRKRVLMDCLEPGETPWVNEIEGTKRFRKKNPVIGFIEWDWYEHMVKHGKWIK